MMRPKCYFISAHNHGIPTHNSFLATCTPLHPLRFPQSVTFCSMLNDRLLFLVARCFLFSARSSPFWVIGGERGGGEANVKENAKDASSSWQWGGPLNPNPLLFLFVSPPINSICSSLHAACCSLLAAHSIVLAASCSLNTTHDASICSLLVARWSPYAALVLFLLNALIFAFFDSYFS